MLLVRFLDSLGFRLEALREVETDRGALTNGIYVTVLSVFRSERCLPAFCSSFLVQVKAWAPRNRPKTDTAKAVGHCSKPLSIG